VIDSAALRARLAGVRDRIARAAGRAGRDPAAIRLIAVSKTFDAAHVRIAAVCGPTDFGENKVQEALDKMDRTGDLPLRWHLVGHLQSNKAAKAASRFDVIHSVDGPQLLMRLDKAAAAAGRRIDLLVQVDIAGEATKHGAAESDLEPIFAAARTCTAARVIGLMLLPPAVEDPEHARPYFRQLNGIRARLLERGVEPAMLGQLSMGMSEDFEVAVEEGATLVRVGTAIFGSRTYV
jgi:pyridoxal phosphate enzyme (YggS family)